MDLCATYNDACKIALGKTGLLNITIILGEFAICKTFDKLDFFMTLLINFFCLPRKLATGLLNGFW